MTGLVLDFTFLSLVFAFISLCLSNRYFKLFAPAYSSFAIYLLSPFSLAMIITVTGAVLLALEAGERLYNRSYAAFSVILLTVFSLLLIREVDWLLAIGAGYFCLRAIHVLLDWWMVKYKQPNALELINYMLFLPVFLVGPINRFPEFARELDRRRKSGVNVMEGVERVLIGLFMTVVLGGFLITRLQILMPIPGTFFNDWAISILGWIDLYFVFAGLSNVAVGTCLIAGIRIAENFDKPYKARSLPEFWSRWHISLTTWCRDYIYTPVANITRKPAVGVIFAMFTLGLWHESSWFFMGWSMWQALGIILSRILTDKIKYLTGGFGMILNSALIFGWLSLANPVVSRVLEFQT